LEYTANIVLLLVLVLLLVSAAAGVCCCVFQNGKTRYLVSNFKRLFPEWKNPLFGELFFTAFSRMEKPVILLFSSWIYSKLCLFISMFSVLTDA
jgi:hypothetical protein